MVIYLRVQTETNSLIILLNEAIKILSQTSIDSNKFKPAFIIIPFSARPLNLDGGISRSTFDCNCCNNKRRPSVTSRPKQSAHWPAVADG